MKTGYYRRLYLSQLRTERQYAKKFGNKVELKKIDAELVRRAQDRAKHRIRK